MIKKQISLRKCFCYCCVCWKKRYNFDSESRDLKILLLGLENVGKTEIGYILAGKKRTHYHTTNGVQCFKTQLAKCSLSITEVGGNRQNQKLWHNYYCRTMGLIFCYDMSIDIQKLQATFQMFNKIASHQFMRGKVILLIGTKSDLANDTIQLYDVENAFALEKLANQYLINIKSIHFNPQELGNLWNGIEWLANNVIINYKNLKYRIENDSKIEKILKKQQYDPVKRAFSLARRRPKTAPAFNNTSVHKSVPFILSSNTSEIANVFRVAEQVPSFSNNNIS
ncbi:ADP-ribosylation factor 6 [Eupeodes corollae]|uniref:ADP-ribosylation factor 6 n=1 Tax=Eupeodes corollae TaxID=290404 RepID=UPI00249343DC|nr:ADP-ribosylation factor 6 [Eupeodes corollae]